YEVELFDPVELHVRQTAELATERGVTVKAEIGDARAIERPEWYAAAVVLLGPLYHLTSRADRLRCLEEALRVLRPGGVLVAAGISRFAAVLDNLGREIIDDDQWWERWAAIRHTTVAGTHVNPQRRPGLFTTAFFHHPDDLASEVAEAGFVGVSVLAVEGPGLLLGDLEARAADPGRWSRLLEVLRWLEAEPSMLGSTGHLLATATRPGGSGA
ncbi:MAG TPA: class I SAM-dependent methyltransferase, partial [Acidimicrobiia bacterium]